MLHLLVCIILSMVQYLYVLPISIIIMFLFITSLECSFFLFSVLLILWPLPVLSMLLYLWLFWSSFFQVQSLYHLSIYSRGILHFVSRGLHSAVISVFRLISVHLIFQSYTQNNFLHPSLSHFQPFCPFSGYSRSFQTISDYWQCALRKSLITFKLQSQI